METTVRPELPTDTQVRAVMAQLLADAAVGTASPTATALAARVGISRPALYRHYRPLVDELLAGAAEQPRPTRPHRSPGRDLEAELARVRRANADLRRHVALYEEVIRQLTIDNTRLRGELEQHAGVTPLRMPPWPRQAD
jgi:AcrR family transcriptional regulator